MSENVVPMDLSSDQALRIIRKIAETSGSVILTNHAKKRMIARGITRRQMDICIEKGVVTEGPFKNSKGDWQLNITRVAAGEDITCVVAIDWPNRLVVITTF